MKTTGRKITLENETYTMTSEAWWLDGAIEINGKACVARVEAEKGADLYFLHFDCNDLKKHNISPGTYEDAKNGVFAPSVQPKQKTVNMQQYNRFLNNLQNEGCF